MTNLKIITKKRCSFCGSEERKPRPVGNYIVKLKKIDVDGDIKLACQTCYIHEKMSRKNETITNAKLRSKLISYLSKIVFP